MEEKTLPACPVETALLFLKDKWQVLIYRELLTGTKRFSELKRALAPVSQKMLTQNLRELEENGMIERKVYPVVPPKVEYSLTPLGLTMKPVIEALKSWGTMYQNKVKEETK